MSVRSPLILCAALLAPSTLLAAEIVNFAGQAKFDGQANNGVKIAAGERAYVLCAAYALIKSAQQYSSETLNGQYIDESTTPRTVVNLPTGALLPYTLSGDPGKSYCALKSDPATGGNHELSVQHAISIGMNGSFNRVEARYTGAGVGKRGNLKVNGGGVYQGGDKGHVSGEAVDPFYVSAGTYTEAPVLDSLTLTNEDTNPAAYTRLEFRATTTLDTDPLWDLVVSLDGNASLAVTFTSAPRLGLDNTTVMTNLLGALNQTDPRHISMVSPSGYVLFNSSFVAPSGFEYGAITSGAADAPFSATGVEASGDATRGLALDFLPNPTTGEGRITVAVSQDSRTTVALYDVTGRPVRLLAKNELLARGSHQWSLDGGGLQAGVYFLRAQASQQAVQRKVVIR